jgi:predicted acyl esterase
VASVARVAIQRVEEMREREKREKERAGPGIHAYVHRADTSADEHKRAGLRGDRDVLCLSATR